MNTARILTTMAVAFCLVGTAAAGWVTSGNNMYSDVSGNVGIGTSSPQTKLDVTGDVLVSGAFYQGPVGKRLWIARGGYADILTEGYDTIEFQPNSPQLADPKWEHFKIQRQGDKVGLYMTGSEYVMGNVGVGTSSPAAKLHVVGDTLIRGRLKIASQTTGTTVIDLGEGLDYAEGFDVTNTQEVGPGTVLVIDPGNTGKLMLSTTAYDTKVAGIVAGAKSLGSGVRLGTGQFDKDVALAGRVYCNVDATGAAVMPGDLLTTSSTPGYAMKVSDHIRAQGAILGKAMERLEQGKKGQILVLVTLQ